MKIDQRLRDKWAALLDAEVTPVSIDSIRIIESRPTPYTPSDPELDGSDFCGTIIESQNKERKAS
jgi:hypothetical protein